MPLTRIESGGDAPLLNTALSFLLQKQALTQDTENRRRNEAVRFLESIRADPAMEPAQKVYLIEGVEAAYGDSKEIKSLTKWMKSNPEALRALTAEQLSQREAGKRSQVAASALQNVQSAESPAASGPASQGTMQPQMRGPEGGFVSATDQKIIQSIMEQAQSQGVSMTMEQARANAEASGAILSREQKTQFARTLGDVLKADPIAGAGFMQFMGMPIPETVQLASAVQFLDRASKLPVEQRKVLASAFRYQFKNVPGMEPIAAAMESESPSEQTMRALAESDQQAIQYLIENSGNADAAAKAQGLVMQNARMRLALTNPGKAEDTRLTEEQNKYQASLWKSQEGMLASQARYYDAMANKAKRPDAEVLQSMWNGVRDMGVIITGATADLNATTNRLREIDEAILNIPTKMAGADQKLKDSTIADLRTEKKSLLAHSDSLRDRIDRLSNLALTQVKGASKAAQKWGGEFEEVANEIDAMRNTLELQKTERLADTFVRTRLKSGRSREEIQAEIDAAADTPEAQKAIYRKTLDIFAPPARPTEVQQIPAPGPPPSYKGLSEAASALRNQGD